jgi:hypothetical protein
MKRSLSVNLHMHNVLWRKFDSRGAILVPHLWSHDSKSKESSTPSVDGTKFRSLVGSMIYLVNTRPDIAYSVVYASRFMEKPTQELLGAIKRIIRYLAGSIKYGCRCGKEEEWKLFGYNESDLVGDIDT